MTLPRKQDNCPHATLPNCGFSERVSWGLIRGTVTGFSCSAAYSRRDNLLFHKPESLQQEQFHHGRLIPITDHYSIHKRNLWARNLIHSSSHPTKAKISSAHPQITNAHPIASSRRIQCVLHHVSHHSRARASASAPIAIHCAVSVLTAATNKIAHKGLA